MLELKKNLHACMDVLTEINVRFGWFVPALVEKARLLMALGDWDQVSDTLQRILGADPQNILAQAWTCEAPLGRSGACLGLGPAGGRAEGGPRHAAGMAMLHVPCPPAAPSHVASCAAWVQCTVPCCG